MTLKQLRYFIEIVRNDLNISHAANALHTSQAAISKQIRRLEEELSVQLFIRRGKRLTRVTRAGQDVLPIAERMVGDMDNLRAAGQDHSDHTRGSLVIAGTPTQICYSLPRVIEQFARRYREVRISLRHGSPAQCAELVLNGDADLCVSTEIIQQYPELLMLPCYRWTRCIVTPRGHPLIKCKPLTLEDIARYPIVTFDFTFAPGSKIAHAFEQRRLKPNVVLTAIDPSVIKTYVGLGFGIGLVGTTAVDPRRDRNLAILDASHLFAPSVTAIGVRRGGYLRRYAYDFIELFAPHLTRNAIGAAGNNPRR